MNPQETHKKIRAVIEKGPNYIFHLMAIARNGFDSAYAEQYHQSISAYDRSILQEHRASLSFSDGSSGDLIALLIFFPAYLNLDSQAAWEEYFGLLLSGLSGESFDPFMNRYAEAIQRQRLWTMNITVPWLQSFSPNRETLDNLAAIYLGNFQRYEDAVWPVESGKMQPVADHLNERLRNMALIEQWEEITQTSFKFDSYEIVLCSATENGPDANSLGYERNSFYYGTERSKMIDWVSHETGTHLLIDLAIELYFDPEKLALYPDGLHYKAHENLALFYNRMILGREPVYRMGTWYEQERFQHLFEQVWKAHPGITPKDLYFNTLGLYLEETDRSSQGTI